MKVKKIKKRLKTFFKKLRIYLFYILKYPQAIIKTPIYLVLYGPKNFLKKIKQLENKVSPIFSYSLLSIIDKLLIFFNPIFYIKGLKVLLTEGPFSTIKKIYLFFFKHKFYSVNYYKKDIEIFLNQRKNDSFDIFIFGVTAFHYRIQRSQHFAFELAKRGHRVFYIENEFNYSNNNRMPKNISILKEKDNLFLVKLCSSKNYFIYSQTPSTKDTEIMFSSLKTIIQKFYVVNPLAIIVHPFWGYLIDKIAMPVIYDLIDYHQGFKENSKKLKKIEEKLLKESEIVITTSDFLFNFAQRYRQNKKIIKIPNAGEFEFFNQFLKKDMEKPTDLPKKSLKIIGYYGAIDYWIDDTLLEKILKYHLDKKLVLIGRVVNKKIFLLTEKYPNLILLGEKPYQELPRYLKFFDICLIPFKINPLIKATDPVKIYEFFAQEKPVVTTAIPELKKYKNCLYYSQNHQQFLKNIARALNENNSKLKEIRRKTSSLSRWENRISVLENELKKTFFPKISIIILSYNNYSYTKKCLQSIEKYSFYPNYEIIIVDNNSDKKTVAYLKSIKNKKIKIIFSQKNLGFAGGNNLGMKNATGDYFILLNNDTLVTPGWISRLFYHIKIKNAGLIGPVTNSIGNESKINIDYDYNNYKDILEKSYQYISQNWGKTLSLKRIAAFCWIQSKEIYKKIGGFDERFFPAFFEDDDYCYRVLKNGYKIYCADDVFIHHFMGTSSSSNKNIFNNRFFIKNKKLFEEKWGKWIPHRYRKGVK